METQSDVAAVRQTVMVVDDIPANITLVGETLRDDYKVIAASGGILAIELVQRYPPDLILLDIMMPDMDGYAVCRWLKQDPRFAAIPVIFLTARDGSEDEVYGLQVGAADYITKPLNAAILRSRIRTQFALSNAYRKLDEYRLQLEKRVEEEVAKRQLQEKLLQQRSRMAAIGEMMDAIAHQWKQPLNAISMNTQMLPLDWQDGRVDAAYIEDYLTRFNRQLDHLNHTLTEFRSFFRPDKALQSVDLRQTLESVLLLMTDELRSQRIHCYLLPQQADEPPLLVHGIANEIKHIFINLIVNARDVFSERLSESREIFFTFSHSEAAVVVTVCDSAGGIPEAVIPHIFDPGFTTKGDQGGSGIGLYLCRQIVNKNQGELTVENGERGACFTLKLPLPERQLTEAI
ncbi:MAG: hybrid sensor histidine kinase/response regulator [Gammaproteobacteria bacterium]|nr:hybrid sensor histidine kinase/response regulator [Gammaproteobacteria bacterium]